MERMVKVLSVAMLASCFANAVSPYLNYRSQGEDFARLVSGTTNHINKADMDTHSFYTSLVTEYTRSFDGDKITKSLFGTCKTLNVKGMSVAGRSATADLAAEWFYLPATYEGTISFKPVIQNFNAELDFQWNMDAWVKGMFFRAYAPLTYTKWNLGTCFKTTVPGADSSITYLHDTKDFFCNKGVATETGYTYEALSCARFCDSCKDNSKWGVADVHADLGWNFLLDQDYHLGLFVHAVAPTGTKVKGEMLFQPVIGNGRSWELGGGLTGGAVLWRNEEENKHFSFHVDGIVSHLFNAKQNRVFDLKGLPLSRYMYAINDAGTTYTPVANLTSCRMKVSAAVQADVTAMFNYTTNNWSFDLGYNFWTRTCEKFECKSCSDCSTSCDSCSTCTPSCCGSCILKNGSTDWNLTHNDATIYTVGTGAQMALTDTNVDYDGAKTKGLSNKVFGNISYAWMDREIVPSLSLGGFAEFGKNDSCNSSCSTSSSSCTTSCSTSCSTNSCSSNCCKYASLSQWGLWLKGGLTF